MDRDTYCATLRAELRDLRIRIDGIRARQARESDGRRVEDAGELEVLERREAVIKGRLEQAQVMDDSLWGRLKAEWVKDWNDLVAAFGAPSSRM